MPSRRAGQLDSVGRVAQRSGVLVLVLALGVVALLLDPTGTIGAARAAGAGPGPVLSGPVRVQAAPGASVLVHGTYPTVASTCVHPERPPLHARYPGTLTVSRQADGTLSIAVELPFEQYLRGIAEMPVTWPAQALQAQVVAARSYALYQIGWTGSATPSTGKAPAICATSACQVYRGLAVPDGPFGARWRQAVQRTAGQVLLYRGRPADTFYFSTSNGRTYGNDEVFGSPSLPYLRPVSEPDDGASPLSHWRSRIRLPDLASFLAAGGHWPALTAIRSVRRSSDTVTVTGTGSNAAVRHIDVATFRDDLNTWSRCLAPDRYPPPNSNGNPLPQTVPSRWFAVTSGGGDATLTGRGWGHGVGMVQWGARGKALRGLAYRQILADYYGGLRPQRYPEPATIRVTVADGLAAVTLVPTGSVTLDRAGVGPGPWRVTGGSAIHVGRGSAPPASISPGAISQVPTRAEAGHRVGATLRVAQLSRARLVLEPIAGPPATVAPVAAGPWGTYQPGNARLIWTVPAIVTGDYRLTAEITDGTDIVYTRAPGIHIDGLAPPSTTPPVSPAGPATTARSAGSGTSSGGGHGLVVAVAAAFAAALVIGGGLLFLRRRTRPSGG
jgi:stage II sporulation protein D (peptidoglycan lytic transglycosylase)